MTLVGRSRELGRLRSLLDGRSPNVVQVSGIRGGGKSSLVGHAMADYPGLIHTCPPLPDPDQRSLLAERIGALPPRDGSRAATEDTDPRAVPRDAGWRELLEAILHRLAPGTRPFVLVLDDAHRLGEARSRYLDPTIATLQEAAEQGIAFHVVLVGSGASLPDVADDERIGEGPLGTGRIEVGPLPFRVAAPLLPGKGADGRIRAYGVFGGIPRVLNLLDDAVTVGTNVRRLVLPVEGPLAHAGVRWLERDLQTPARYYAIMRTLARGQADWATVHAGVADLTRSGQVAPYLNRLVELGLVSARRSVDASPRSRSTRYSLTDPFLAFWFRFAFPLRFSAGSGEKSTRLAEDGESDPGTREGDIYARRIRPAIDEHMRTVFPLICRQHMTYDAIETLGAVAREGGSLWGSGYDLPVAGTLTSGAVYYGACRWDPEAEPDSALEEIEESLGETRYGFGRERRLRLVFTGRAPSVELRRAAVRTQDAQLIDAEALLG